MSIAALLQAAEYLDRREREAEHGYATTMPMPDDLNRNRRPKIKKSQGNSRTTHNELEKNRRAHLRSCLEKLKEMVPLGPESNRHTTLGLLTRAKVFIKSALLRFHLPLMQVSACSADMPSPMPKTLPPKQNLEDKDRKHAVQKEQLYREQRYLRRRLEQLGSQLNNMHKRRSVSECSTSTSSTSSTSETDEVDIMGYNSNQSDTDDHSSIQSMNSDGGVAISTKRLTLKEPL